MPAVEIEENRIVLAKWKDNEHVRARVTFVDLDKGEVRIKNCDRWGERTVTTEDIFYMIPSFMNVPFRVSNNNSVLNS